MNAIEVSKSDGRWAVTRGRSLPAVESFTLKSHAIAYARALAQSSGTNLIVRDADGRGEMQSRATLTYPTDLD
jgi:hypothetical protein